MTDKHALWLEQMAARDATMQALALIVLVLLVSWIGLDVVGRQWSPGAMRLVRGAFMTGGLALLLLSMAAAAL
jgi:hypothetical protein